MPVCKYCGKEIKQRGMRGWFAQGTGWSCQNSPDKNHEIKIKGTQEWWIKALREDTAKLQKCIETNTPYEVLELDLSALRNGKYSTKKVYLLPVKPEDE